MVVHDVGLIDVETAVVDKHIVVAALEDVVAGEPKRECIVLEQRFLY